MSLTVKSLVARLPGPLQQFLRKRHYLKKLQDAEIDDEPELGVVPVLVGEGDVVLDIGANFGLFTRFLSEAVGEEGRVFSFEPTPDMFAVLSHSARGLGWKNVSCHQLALSDRPGQATMSIPIRGDGSRNHYEASLDPGVADCGGAVESFTTGVVTLDEFSQSASMGRVAFIKCDVEGHEIAVLRGARALLARDRPTILLEVNEPLHEPGHGSAVREFLEEIGYRIHIFEKGRVTPLKPGDVRVNYVLLPG
ncbi:MAG: FkbM family methyltransferase [Verrucomicrobiaceae bacterium]|nr:FkbM family methyltransferase [Verrucomicrobiaceae bacterium]